MLFIPAIHTYSNDIAAQRAWQILSQKIGGVDGYAYYKHPSLGIRTGSSPDLAILAKGYDALVVRVLNFQVIDIEKLSRFSWQSEGASLPRGH